MQKHEHPVLRLHGATSRRLVGEELALAEHHQLGLPFVCAGPLAGLALSVSGACWLKVIAPWRALPRRGRGDDGHGWWRWGSDEAPLNPGGGGGGITVDWAAFEREFWSHVAEIEHRREGELVHAQGRGGLGLPDGGAALAIRRPSPP